MDMMNATSCSCDDEAASFAIPVPFNFLTIIILICLSAMFSGLTLGLLSLDKIGLQIVIGGDDPQLARYAKAILPVRENGNLLLCTLLLGNVAVNALLAILMADMTSGVLGFLISTVVIVIFGEIIPQASCSRHALLIGFHTLYVTKLFIVLLYFAAYPLGALLDWALGADLGTIHSKRELETLLDLHVKHGAVDIESGNMLHGALKFREMIVQEIMTPASEAFMIPLSEKLSVKIVQDIFRSGYSRIPVYDKDKNDVMGVLLSKDLLLVDPKEEIPVRNFMTLFGRAPMVVWPDQKLGEILNLFSASHRHMCIVRDVNNTGAGDPFYEVKGIVTLEDIVEEILGQEIGDETDLPEGELEGDAIRQKDRDLAMLALISGKSVDEKLSPDEIQAISSHLTNNLPEFMTSCTEISKGRVADVPALQEVLSKAVVVSGERKSTKEMLDKKTALSEDILYRRNEASAKCILVLSGKVVVYAGKDQFRSELGPWSLLGTDALTLPDDQFAPDFSAFISSDSIRLLVLTKKDFYADKKRKKSATQRKPRGASGDSIGDAALSQSVENSPVVREHVAARNASVIRPDAIGVELAPVDAANGVNGDGCNGHPHAVSNGNGGYVAVSSSPGDENKNRI